MADRGGFLWAALALCACAHGGANGGPAAGWQARCAARLQAAQAEAAKIDPGFATGEVVMGGPPASVSLEMEVRDPIHGRFFDDAPAKYVVSIREEAANEPGEIGAKVGAVGDEQTSVGLTRWSKLRNASMGADIVQAKKAKIFSDAFGPAIDDCLR